MKNGANNKNNTFIKIIASFFKWLLVITLIAIFIGAVSIFGIDYYVRSSCEAQIISIKNVEKLKSLNADCIMVLGAQVLPNGKPSPMLEERIIQGNNLYKLGVAPKILESGDHMDKYYDEVNIMKNYAIESGIPSSDIFMDHAGISTYDSMYRAKNVFGVKRMIIVSQRYHLYRAVYIAEKLGIEVYGVPCDVYVYSGQQYREIREILARNKDFFKTITKPMSVYGGKKIDIKGSGDVTNDNRNSSE